MRSRPPVPAVLAGFLLLTACADGPTGPVSPNPAPPPLSLQGDPSESGARHQRLARRLALALGDPAFRASLHQALRESPEREGKVHLQYFARGPVRQRLAVLSGDAEPAVAADLEATLPIEVYLPVPAHRAAWQGGSDILVATAESDREAPVAFDTRGRRISLDPARPPAVPVLALVRAEQPFRGEVSLDETCFFDCGTPPGGDPGGGEPPIPALVSPGLYMTYAKLNSDFEGWLKGSPEFEVHILGQDGTSLKMKSYQCSGANAGAPYAYDQNDLEWSGQVLLFSQNQLDAYRAEHPNQSLRIFLLEDDDTDCGIKMDSTRVTNFFKAIESVYGTLTGGKDTKIVSIKTFIRALSLLNIFKSAWSVITTQDDLVGTAIEDVVAREYFPNANWIVKGENNVSNGAIRLEMR